jgi:Putative prokaryotic signal transducing protein
MELVTVFRTFSPGEAQLVRSRLEAAGFIAEVTHELSALSMDGYSMAAGGVRVQVPSEQAEEARALIDAPDADHPAT